MKMYSCFLTIAFSILDLSLSTSIEIQYSEKIMSDTKGDGFGYSLASSNHHVVVGAPIGRYVLVDKTKIPVPYGRTFGRHVDVNKNFVVVSWKDDYVFVYSSSSHDLIASIRINKYYSVVGVKLTHDSTIVIASSNDKKSDILVYKYDQNFSWDLNQKISLNMNVGSLAVSSKYMVAGCPAVDKVVTYRREKGQYAILQALHSPLLPLSTLFGINVAMDDHHLAVTSFFYSGERVIFTYEFETKTEKWLNNGQLVISGSSDYASISLQSGILAVGVSDHLHKPEVCAYVYNASTNVNDGNNSNNANSMFTWNRLATLKTNGLPIKSSSQWHSTISVQKNTIFTGRYDISEDEEFTGMVFEHNLSKHFQHQ